MIDRRLGDGGDAINRRRVLTFTFEGKALTGLAGDTVASALLANGIRVLGHSPRYRRPRGVMTDGLVEPAGFVQVDGGPAVAAPLVPLREGMAVRRLPAPLRWAMPSAPWLAPGLQHRLLLGPGGGWRRVAPLVRHAAGRGRLRGGPDGAWQGRTADCDVLVIGGGVAGLAAALTAAEAGHSVILAEATPACGGHARAEGPEGGRLDDLPAAAWVADTLKAARDAGARILTRTAAVAQQDQSVWLAETGDAGATLWQVTAGRVVLATGAVERPLVFPDNDRPGVMMAGAVASYLHRYGVWPGDRLVLFTNRDASYRLVLDALAAGRYVAAVVDLRRQAEGPLAQAVRSAGVPVLTGHTIVAGDGDDGLARVRIMRLRDDGHAVVPGYEVRIDCDLLAMSGGWAPMADSWAAAMDLRAGAVRGIAGLDAAVADGRRAGRIAGGLAARDCGPEVVAAGNAQAAGRLPAADPGRRAWAFVDIAADVTAEDLRRSVAEGYHSLSQIERYAGLGCGLDQGRLGRANAADIVGAAVGLEASDLPPGDALPPGAPVPLGALATVAPVHGPRPVGGDGSMPRVIVAGHAVPLAWPGPRESADHAARREADQAVRAVGLIDEAACPRLTVWGDAAVLAGLCGLDDPGDRTRGVVLADSAGVLRHLAVLRPLAEGWALWGLAPDDGGLAALLTRAGLTVRDDGAARGLWRLVGPRANRLITELVDQDSPHVPAPTIAGQPVTLCPCPVRGDWLIATGADQAAVCQAVTGLGDGLGLTRIGWRAAEALRVAAGLARLGVDNDRRSTAADLDLGDLRADRPPSGRRLVGLVGGDGLVAGAALRDGVDGPVVGRVTSAARRPGQGGRIALGLVDRGLAVAGRQLLVALALRNGSVRVVSPGDRSTGED